MVESVDVHNPNDRDYLEVNDFGGLEIHDLKKYLNDELE